MFLKYIDFSLLTKCLRGRMKCLNEPVEMASRARFDLRAVVWRPLIYSIFVLLFYPKLGTSHETSPNSYSFL